MTDRDTRRPPKAGKGTEGPLDAARTAFAWLTVGPDPVALDGGEFVGLPTRVIPVDQLRDVLLDRGCPQATRDAVWATLIDRSRTAGGAWTVVCVGMALPALTRVCAQLCDRFAGDRYDVHAGVLTGFLAGLATVDSAAPRIMLRLRWAAYRGGLEVVRDALAAPTPRPTIATDSGTDGGDGAVLGHVPGGHPDLVLARAVADGALTRADAALIGTTRLEAVTLIDAATARGQSYAAVRKARARAERRLVTYLRDADADADADLDPSSGRVAGPRVVPRTPPTRESTITPGSAGSAGGAGSATGSGGAPRRSGSTRPARPTPRRSSRTVTARTDVAGRAGPGGKTGAAQRVSQTGPGSGVQPRQTTRPPRRGRLDDAEVRSC